MCQLWLLPGKTNTRNTRRKGFTDSPYPWYMPLIAGTPGNMGGGFCLNPKDNYGRVGMEFHQATRALDNSFSQTCLFGSLNHSIKELVILRIQFTSKSDIHWFSCYICIVCCTAVCDFESLDQLIKCYLQNLETKDNISGWIRYAQADPPPVPCGDSPEAAV
jgi:hypothetical protein